MIRALTILSLLCAPSVANPCRVRQRVVVQEVIAVPVAVPVGVPVASVVPNMPLYSASGYAAQPQDAALYQEFLEYKAARVKAQAVPKTAVQASCIQCHSGATPKGKLDLSGELTPEVRLRAVAKVVTGAMPPTAKKTPLSAESLGKLIEELSTVPATAKAQVEISPPPPATPKE